MTYLKITLLVLILFSIACAEDKKDAPFCQPITEIPKIMVIAFGQDRAAQMERFLCQDGCYVGIDSLGKERVCSENP